MRAIPRTFTNDTHASTSDSDSRLYRKAVGKEAKLCYMGHALMENRNGLAVGGIVTVASGKAERRASETMLKAKAQEQLRRITVAEDTAYDTADHVATFRHIGVTPHVVQNNPARCIRQNRSKNQKYRQKSRTIPNTPTQNRLQNPKSRNLCLSAGFFQRTTRVITQALIPCSELLSFLMECL